MTRTVKRRIEEIQAEAARLSALLEMYPDLTLKTDRWRRTVACSKAINASATDYELYYSCGCCTDPALYVRVYCVTPLGKVYGLPLHVEIGERDEIDLPIEDWDVTLRELGYREEMIERLQEHFDNQAQEAPEEGFCSRAS